MDALISRFEAAPTWQKVALAAVVAAAAAVAVAAGADTGAVANYLW